MSSRLSIGDLRQRQSLPLEAKVRLSAARIRDWHDNQEGRVYVSFSGGKDSTVLLHLVRTEYPNTLAVYCNTGLDFPETVSFVKDTPNCLTLRPAMGFREVLSRYGYPVVSKEQSTHIYTYRKSKSASAYDRIPLRWRYLTEAPFLISAACCHQLKIKPVLRYEAETNRTPYLGTTADESRTRLYAYLAHGCNVYDSRRPRSSPLSFWKEDDVWAYIRDREIKYSPVYDMGYERTGCIFCMFGIHFERNPNRIQRMAVTHPKLYEYCLKDLGVAEVMDYIGVSYATNALHMSREGDRVEYNVFRD